MNKYDFLIVGAGLSGLVAAQQLCKLGGKRCLLIDSRDHIAGNCYDYYDNHGILIHKYGPHYFRSNSEDIVRYLSIFTEWISAEYRVLSYIDGKYYNFPINLNTFEQVIGRKSNEKEMLQVLEDWRVPIDNANNSEEIIISQVGRKLYEMFFEGYTIKQWKKHPRELDPSVCGRIPIRTNRDDRYLREKIQLMPKYGYSRLCENIVSSCGDLLTLKLNTDFERIRGAVDYEQLIYTGMIDRYYNYKFGRLPYRSLRFELEHHADVDYFQPQMQVNYPSVNIAYTRTIEIKHATRQEIKGTTVVKEYPVDYDGVNEPYYPIPCTESKRLYKLYKERAHMDGNVTFLGRLGTYSYYNMDQCVAMALTKIKRFL